MHIRNEYFPVDGLTCNLLVIIFFKKLLLRCIQYTLERFLRRFKRFCGPRGLRI